MLERVVYKSVFVSDHDMAAAAGLREAADRDLIRMG
jgi:hypothetical protein